MYDLSFAKMPSVFIFIAFQIARVGRSERLLTVKKSGTLFNSSAGWSFGEGQLHKSDSALALQCVSSTMRPFEKLEAENTLGAF
jgi:hypothetical protein